MENGEALTLVDRLVALKMEHIKKHQKLVEEIDYCISILQKTDAERVVKEGWKLLGEDY